MKIIPILENPIYREYLLAFENLRQLQYRFDRLVRKRQKPDNRLRNDIETARTNLAYATDAYRIVFTNEGAH